MGLLHGGGLDERVLGEEVVEEGRPALGGPDDDEVGQRARFPLQLEDLVPCPLRPLCLLVSLGPGLRRAMIWLIRASSSHL